MAGETMQGTRVPDGGEDPYYWAPGSYGRSRADGGWVCICPDGSFGNLGAHDVTEHDDGTITVSPSILVSEGRERRELWHGWLERGVWRSV